MPHKDVTIASIEAATPKEVAYERTNYLVTYGLHNPWTGWILRQDSRLLEKPQWMFAGWADDWTPAEEGDVWDGAS